jgi:hypothetical protein
MQNQAARALHMPRQVITPALAKLYSTLSPVARNNKCRKTQLKTISNAMRLAAGPAGDERIFIATKDGTLQV